MDKREKFIKTVINKMLNKHNVDYDYVKDNPEIEGVPWYQHYTMTTQEELELEKFFISLYKKMKLGSRSEKEWAWFNLMYGLKIDNNG